MWGSYGEGGGKAVKSEEKNASLRSEPCQLSRKLATHKPVTARFESLENHLGSGSLCGLGQTPWNLDVMTTRKSWIVKIGPAIGVRGSRLGLRI